jgi:RNA polymerase sigma-70 factor (ECF subfamily)
MKEMSDTELLTLVADGSTVALEELYHRHAAWPGVRLSRRCADPAVVDEVLQDTFVAVWRSARGFTGRGEPAAWLWGIAIRRLIDAFRKRPPAMVVVRDSDLAVVESAEDHVLLGVEHGDLGGALDRLAPELRAVVQATVLDRVQAPQPGRIERFLRRCGLAESTARLLAVTPTLRGSWLTGVVLVLVLAELSANTSAGGIALFMALAPVLPLISVAAAFGREMDPAREMVGAALYPMLRLPYPMLRLMLLRTACVVASTVVPAAALTLLIPGSTWLALGWLLPSLALIGAVLSVTARVPALPTAGVLAAGWLSLIAAGWIKHHDAFLAASSPVQLVSAAVQVTTLVLLLVRRENFSEEIRRSA